MTIAQYPPINGVGKDVCKQCNRPAARLYLQFACKSTPFYVLSYARTSGGAIRWPWRQPHERHGASLALGGRAADAAHGKAAVEIVGAVTPGCTIVDEGFSGP